VAGLFPSEVARLYGMTTAGQGVGQCIAIVSPRGGYDRGDLAAACAAMKIAVPEVIDVAVGTGANRFGVDHEGDREVSLDVQVIAGVAPSARIVVYFTESDEYSYAKGVAQAVHDAVHRPNVIVFTWGESEDFWPDDARAAMDDTLADAVKLRVTVVAAAGDDLATERRGDGKAHVDYPAASPFVLACGGTELTLGPAGDSIVEETVWNTGGSKGTGGGISGKYPVPSYQKNLALPPSVNAGDGPGRGVPDVAAAASENNGYRIVFNDTDIVTGGTSATAPLWAAFIALVNEQCGLSLGFINPTLYANPALFRPITTGNNMAFGLGYSAGPGWNACAGLGAPMGAAILAHFTAVA
jgi:kumamolisin